ncbi:hypothetical protein D477_021388 [Arthrobacter crystallopoietes BAB-32]|uniref:Uncharacterized protein n=1 Tax=Arthrobacter crystallopoietes BAB-32 TaxID=1246476 RepID=N1V1S4_9MICC|nr:hypothetical protein D477_021388 [Arthrobacter crystallopoietes BAB-32]
MFAGLLSVLAYLRPGWLPGVYLRALVDVHRYLTPLSVAAAALVPSFLGAGDYALLTTAAAAYYLAVLVTGRDQDRAMNVWGLRLAATLAVLFWTLTAGSGWPGAFFAAVAVLGLQVAGMAIFPERYGRFLQPAAGPAADRGAAGSGTGDGTSAGDSADSAGTAWLVAADLMTTFGLQVLGAAGALAAGLVLNDGEGQPDPVLPLLLLLAAAAVVGWRRQGWADLLVAVPLVLSVVLLDDAEP